jgi:prophage regulatory protein
LLHCPTERERTGLSRTTIWRLERHGKFPKHRRISANTAAWVEDEAMTWIQSKIGANCRLNTRSIVARRLAMAVKRYREYHRNRLGMIIL